MTARGKAYSENIIGVYVKFLGSLMEQFHAHGSFEKLCREAVFTFYRIVKHKGIEAFCKEVESYRFSFSGRNIPVCTARENEYGFSFLIVGK